MNKRKKRTMLILGTALVLIALSLVVILSTRSGSFRDSEKSFAVEDTTAINKIFIADRHENQVLLEKQADGQWLVNGDFIAVQKSVSDLLNVIQNITVREPVALAARENVTKWMASGSTKAEVYFQDYRIKIGKLKWWKYQNKKVYYIGGATQDNLGNYAVLEGGKIPFIVYLPGFRGFISPYFASSELDWKSRNIIKLRLSQIKQIELLDFENPEESFKIVHQGGRKFDMIALNTNTKLGIYDTAKLFEHLEVYRDLNYEQIIEIEKDSALKNKFKELVITDMDNKQTKITLYHIENVYNTEEYDYHEEFMEMFNRDKFYAVINGNEDEIVVCQYFVFDRIVQPLSYYSPDNEQLPIPK